MALALLGILVTTMVARTALIQAVAVFGLLNIHMELTQGVGTLGSDPNNGWRARSPAS